MRNWYSIMSAAVMVAIVPLAQVKSQEVLVKPLPGPGPIDNPLKGWCPYTDAGEIHQPYSMVYFYVPWSQLEPKQGDYQFEEWEATWNVAAAEGKHVIFRVYIDYPGQPSGLPDWLRQAGVKETHYDAHGGGQSPDYNNSQMVRAMEDLIAALGARYNKHPRIAFIQLGLLGFWGEWHTWPRDEMYASPQTEQRVIDAYRRAFPDKSLMVRYARDYAGQQAWIGFHDDMFPEDTDNGKDWSFLAGLQQTGRSANWKSAVVGGEMVPNQAKLWLGQEYSTSMTMLQRAHFTWVGPYCPALEESDDAEFLQHSQELVRKMGYQFQIGEVRHDGVSTADGTFNIWLKGENQGVAPFYYPWSIEWALFDGNNDFVTSKKTAWDVRNWKPGQFSESVELSFNVPAGKYQLALGIRDPWKDRPAIRFANQVPVIDGWTVLSQLKIVR
ncbi:MAG: DUF4832 domain-containing protein [bacterium]|nr:DUF4832 domain-containing protein [bacterium]